MDKRWPQPSHSMSIEPTVLELVEYLQLGQVSNAVNGIWQNSENRTTDRITGQIILEAMSLDCPRSVLPLLYWFFSNNNNSAIVVTHLRRIMLSSTRYIRFPIKFNSSQGLFKSWDNIIFLWTELRLFVRVLWTPCHPSCDRNRLGQVWLPVLEMTYLLSPAKSPFQTSASPGFGEALSEYCQNEWKLVWFLRSMTKKMDRKWKWY